MADCPFSWSVAGRLAEASARATTAQHRRFLAELAADAPAVDVPVVCEGDACAPNTLLGDDGRWSGHVDLGALGVADPRWADLAVATWSTERNYGHGWEHILLDAYGVGPDDVGAREREQERYGFADVTDVIVYSHEVGLAKPDPRVYALTCGRLGVDPGGVVLLDDTPAAVEGALVAGWQAVLFGATAQAIADVEACLAT